MLRDGKEGQMYDVMKRKKLKQEDDDEIKEEGGRENNQERDRFVANSRRQRRWNRLQRSRNMGKV